MAENLLSALFQNHVPKAGYRVVESDAYLSQSDYIKLYFDVPRADWRMRFVVETDPSGPPEDYRRETIPSGLFINMAKTDRTEQGILGFLNRYGRLWYPSHMIADVDAEGRLLVDDYGVARWEAATPYGVLVHHFFELSVAVSLWDMVKHGRVSELKRAFTVEPREVSEEYETNAPGTGLGQEGEPHLVFRAGDVFGEIPPRDYEVSSRLTGYGGTLVSYPIELGPLSAYSNKPGRIEVRAAFDLLAQLADTNLQRGAALRMKAEGNKLSLSLNVTPNDLLGAIWLQLALAITRQTEFRECPACGVWFEISPSVARTDKVFCSAACRSRTHKRKRSEVLRMHAAGMVLNEIADKVEVPVDTAQRWIAKEEAADAKETRP